MEHALSLKVAAIGCGPHRPGVCSKKSNRHAKDLFCEIEVFYFKYLSEVLKTGIDTFAGFGKMEKKELHWKKFLRSR
ncbi:hypothetical protein [Solidesulfovibrio fructosivorans]|uniref:hypothetical protein n=1 Tax=Solidesulfovibrio fructosivorans TaxID=878 RepID=UPI0005C2521D|nr:hypothetical protein [Solidesulfovibrio fructosivorans]